jgi:diphthamide biosynthesis protein 7
MSTQEEKGGWFDALTTPLNACSLETYFPITRDDGINSSSDKPSDVPLVVGCYQLNKSSQSDPEDPDTASSSAGSSRCGELRLHMIPTPSTSKTEMQFGDAACVLQMESGVLDGKWKRRRKNNQTAVEIPLFASACASGSIHIHGLEKNMSTDSTTDTTSWSLNHLASTDGQIDTGLCLALAWNDYLNESEDQIVSSYSNGEVAIHQVSYHGDTNKVPKLEETHRWNAHTLFGCPSEVWTCSFLRGAENVVLSGADDCSMKVWDIRQTQRPVHKVGDREFEAGVTAISSHPSLDNIFAVGSYDEHVRLYDYRKMAEPLSKVPVGGGVWRIKWHPSTWSGESSCRGKLLVAAMHGGCRIVNFPSLDGGVEEYTAEEADVLSEFTAHESMAYGADWISFGSPELEAAASCSFYDRKAFIWE